MKKSLTITVAVLTLGVLSAVLWFTTSHNTEHATSTDTTSTSGVIATETSDVNTSSETTDALISVLNLQATDIHSIEVSVGNDTLNYISGKENWSLKGYENYALDQSGLNYKAKVMLNIKAACSIKNANLAEYGLDVPTKKATYYLKDGTTISVSLGNLSLDQLSVYMMIDSDPSTVYVAESKLYNCMIGNINSYRSKELENYDSAAIYSIAISGSDFETVSLTLSPEQNGYSTSYNLSTDKIQNALANTNSVEQLKAALPSYKVSHFVADHITDLSAYGLDQPVLHLTTNYYDPKSTTSNTPNANNDFDMIGQVDYIWGNTLDNGEIAFMKVGDTSVYSMDGSFLSNLKEVANPFYLISKYIAMPHIDKVTAIDVVFDDVSYHMTVDEANEKYSLDNQTMTKEKALS